MELVEMVLALGRPVEVTGRQGGRPGVYLATEVVVQMEQGTGRVAGFMFIGRRQLRTRPAELTRYAERFLSDDPTLSGAKLTARRVAAAAQHKLAGDPAGRRAS